jgi:hypothetical protein
MFVTEVAAIPHTYYMLRRTPSVAGYGAAAAAAAATLIRNHKYSNEKCML